MGLPSSASVCLVKSERGIRSPTAAVKQGLWGWLVCRREVLLHPSRDGETWGHKEAFQRSFLPLPCDPYWGNTKTLEVGRSLTIEKKIIFQIIFLPHLFVCCKISFIFVWLHTRPD